MKAYNPRLTPKDHQHAGTAAILAGNANFDDQGLGKAKQLYDAIGKLFQERKIDLAVVGTKASLLGNFYNEVVRDAGQLIPKVVRGSKAERMAVYRHPACHVLILSYETIVTDLEALTRLFGSNRVFFGIDEGQYVKNSETQRAVACTALADLAFGKTVLGGTPISNSETDAYSQLRFLGLDVGNTVEEFKLRYPTPESLRDLMRGRFIRRRKEEVKELNLPSKRIEVIEVDLSEEERRVYDLMVDDLLLEVQAVPNQEHVDLGNHLTALLRMIQYTSNPALITSSVPGRGAKMKKLDEVVRGVLVDPDEKIIIWTSFRKNVEALLERYKEFSAVALYGGVERDALMKNAKRFQEDPACRVLIAIPQCAREGFTLTRARNAVYLDRNFSYLDWAQSQDRIHRISQVKECRIITIEAKDTIDQRIDEVLKRKGELQRFLLGETDEYNASASLSFEEFKSILTARNTHEASHQ